MKSRKLLKFVLVFTFVLSSITCVNAEEDIYPMPDDYVAPEHYYTDSEVLTEAIRLPGNSSNSVVVPGDLGGSTFNGLSSSNVEVIYKKTKSTGTVPAVNYDGIKCYKFEFEGDTVYVPTTYMYKATSGVCSINSFNTTITNYINNQNTSNVDLYAYYSYKYQDNVGNIIYRFSIMKLTGNTDVTSGIQPFLNVKVVGAVAFDVYDNFINCISTYTPSIKVKPTISFNITNTGSTTKSLYFQKIVCTGKGENTSTSSYKNLVSLGLKAYQLYSTAVSNVNALEKFANIFNDEFKVGKSSSGSRYVYSSSQPAISNPAENKYTYQTKTVFPFYLKKANDYSEVDLNISESRISSSRFKITLSLNVTK